MPQCHLPHDPWSAARGAIRPRSRALAAAIVLALATGCGSEPDPEPAASAGARVAGPATSSSAAVDPAAVVVEAELEPTGAVDRAAEPPPVVFDRSEADFAAEIPDNSLAYFEFESLTALEELSLRISTLVEFQGHALFDSTLATVPIAGVGIDPSLIDRDARIALAYVPVPGELFPAPMVIVPARDEGPVVVSFSALATRGMKVRRIGGGYAVVEPIGMNDSVDRGDSGLISDLPEANIRGRFDSSTFLPLLKPSLEPLCRALNESYRLARPKTSSGDLYEFEPESFTQLVRDSQEVGFGFSLDGDRASISLRLVGGQKETYGTGVGAGDISATLNELSHHIDREDPVSFVTAFEPETAVSTLRHLWENRDDWSSIGRTRLFGAEDDDARNQRSKLSSEALDSMERATVRMLDSFQPGAALSFQMEPSKAHVAIYLAARNPDRAREAISLLLSKCDLETWGFEMALPIRSMMDGTLVEDYSVRFDTRRLDFDRRAAMRNAFKTYLGDSSLHLKVATSGRHVLVILGGDTMAVDTRIREFSEKGLAEVEHVRAIDLVGGADAATVYHADFVKIFGQLSGLGAVAEGHSVADTHRELIREVGDNRAPFVIWSGPEGNDVIFGASFELSSLTTAFDAFKGSGL
ncbi:hypothetical protein [Saltatorellus ferox]